MDRYSIQLWAVIQLGHRTIRFRSGTQEEEEIIWWVTTPECRAARDCRPPHRTSAHLICPPLSAPAAQALSNYQNRNQGCGSGSGISKNFRRLLRLRMLHSAKEYVKLSFNFCSFGHFYGTILNCWKHSWGSGMFIPYPDFFSSRIQQQR